MMKEKSITITTTSLLLSTFHPSYVETGHIVHQLTELFLLLLLLLFLFLLLLVLFFVCFVSCLLICCVLVF